MKNSPGADMKSMKCVVTYITNSIQELGEIGCGVMHVCVDGLLTALRGAFPRVCSSAEGKDSGPNFRFAQYR